MLNAEDKPLQRRRIIRSLTSELARQARGGSFKGADVAFAPARNHWRGTFQVDDAGGFETAVAPIDHGVDDVIQALLDLLRISEREVVSGSSSVELMSGSASVDENGARHRMVGHADADRPPSGVLQPLGRFAGRLQNEGIGTGSERLERPVLLIADARVSGDLRQVAAHEREMMMLVGLADSGDALHRGLVADMAAERITGVGRIDDDAALTNDVHSLPDQARLGISGVNFAENGWAWGGCAFRGMRLHELAD